MLILILLVALFIRLLSLNQSLWLDEATTALTANLSLYDFFHRFMPGDFHPPLYYIVVRLWTEYFGINEFSLRMPSLIFGLGTIVFTYLIASNIGKSKWIAPLAALMVATNGLMVYYSQEARMYAMACFLVTAVIYFFMQRLWLMFSLSLAMLGMTDYLALLIIIPLTYLGYKKKEFYLSLIPLALAYLIWAPTFLIQLTVGASVKTSSPLWWKILGTLSLKNALLIPVKFVLGRINFENFTLYSTIAGLTVIIYAKILYMAKGAPKILWMWLLMPIVTGMALAIKIPTLTYFRFLFCIPALYILIAFGISKISPTRFKIVAFVALLIINLATTFYYLTNPAFHREDWKSLVSFIESNRIENSVVLFRADSNQEAYKYYAPETKIIGPKSINESYDEVWAVNYLADIFDPGNLSEDKLIKSGYAESRYINFRGIGVKRFLKIEN